MHHQLIISKAQKNSDCRMYISFIHILTSGFNGAEGLSLRSQNGAIWQSPGINPPSIGPSSGLLPVTAVSCKGCDSIVSSISCQGTFETAV